MEEWILPSRTLLSPCGEGLSRAEARETARDILAGLKSSSAGLDNVLLVVTELISHASRQAGGATGFQVTARSDAVTVEISNRSPSPPRIQPWATACTRQLRPASGQPARHHRRAGPQGR